MDPLLSVQTDASYVVVAVASDDLYGAAWYYGPYADKGVADNVAIRIARQHDRVCGVHPMLLAVPTTAPVLP